MAYIKLFQSILTSTIWTEDDATRIVWITLMALADRHGEVQASIPGLARLAGVSVESCQKAIAKFLAPDEFSRTKDDEGRRLMEIDGGWLLINHGKYRVQESREDLRVAESRRKARYRNKLRERVKTGTGVDMSQEVPDSVYIADADADADAEGDAEYRSRPQKQNQTPAVQPPHSPLEGGGECGDSGWHDGEGDPDARKTNGNGTPRDDLSIPLPATGLRLDRGMAVPSRPVKEKAPKQTLACPEGVTPESWKALRFRPKPYAWQLALKRIEGSNVTPQELVDHVAQAGWAGFNPAGVAKFVAERDPFAGGEMRPQRNGIAVPKKLPPVGSYLKPGEPVIQDL